MLNKRHIKNIGRIRSTGIYLTLNLNDCYTLKIAQVYAPTSSSTEEKHEQWNPN